MVTSHGKPKDEVEREAPLWSRLFFRTSEGKDLGYVVFRAQVVPARRVPQIDKYGRHQEGRTCEE